MEIQQQLSREKVNQIMSECVPLEDRLKSVYLPTILMDNACMFVEYIQQIFRETKCSATKPINRRMQDIVKRYKSKNRMAMKSELCERVMAKSTEFFTFLHQHLTIDECTYNHALWKQYPDQHGKVTSKVLFLTYYTKQIIKYIIKFERESAEEVRRKVGRRITYRTEDNEDCIALLECLNDLTSLLKAPTELKDYHIELSYRVFKNKVGQIDIQTI